MCALKNPLVLYNSSFYFTINRYVSPASLRSMCQNKIKHARDSLEILKRTVKGNGKGPEGGQEGCQTNAGLELVKGWGRGLGV